MVLGERKQDARLGSASFEENEPYPQTPLGVGVEGLYGFGFEARDVWRELDTFEFLNDRLKPLLLGKTITLDGKTITVGKVMNEKGVNKLLSIVAVHTSPHVILGSFTDREIKRRARDCAEHILDVFIDNWRDYDMRLEDVEHIALIFQDFVEGVLSRAKGGAERKLTAPNRRVVEQINRFLGDKKQGLEWIG